jgi:hypothetical protein
MGAVFSVFMGFRLQAWRERLAVSGVGELDRAIGTSGKDREGVIYFTGGISIAAAFTDGPIPQHDTRRARKHVETKGIVC